MSTSSYGWPGAIQPNGGWPGAIQPPAAALYQQLNNYLYPTSVGLSVTPRG